MQAESSAASTQTVGAGAIAAPAPARPESFTRSLVLWVACASHAVDHFQNSLLSVLYPVIMAELGFGYAQLGVLTAIRSAFQSASQVVYGFLTPFVRRSRLLAAGNLTSAGATALTGLAPSYPAFVGTRAFFSLGSSAQHPVGSSLLAEHFVRRRGTALALNGSMASFGALIAPALGGVLLLVLTWRQIFWLAAIASLAMGIGCLFFRDRPREAAPSASSKRSRLQQGKASYLRVLRNRNMLIISLIMMAGAAGRGDGVNNTYLGPHLVNDLALSTVMAGLALSAMQIGGIGGTIGLGWLSDRVSRKLVMQASLLLSALFSWTLAGQGPYLPLLVANLLVYGAATNSRMSLTQALLADSLDDADRDAAFSVFFFIGFISGPIWALVTGFLMESFGFGTAFTVLSFSYLVGMVVLVFLKDPREARRAAGSRQ